MLDVIEKDIELKASPDRVWRALTDYREFGEWFRVALEGPFVVGEVTRGPITYPGAECLRMEVRVTAMEAPRHFAFTWHPYAIDPSVDYSTETPTLVEFRLEPMGTGTRVRVTESGFAHVPAHRRHEAFRMNERGWSIQMQHMSAHVDGVDGA